MGSKLFSSVSIALSIFGASLSMLPFAAAALDAKSYAGANCVGTVYDFSSIVHDPRGSVTNIDGQTSLTAWCPIVGDNVINQAGLNRARVYVSESTVPSTTTQCTIHALTESGLVSQTRTASAPANGNQTIDLLQNQPLNASPLNARYLLTCELSPLSVLYKYEIEER